MTRLVLASTSPARLTLLRNGGIEPICIAPQVDEDLVAAVAEAEGLIKSTADMVGILARAKAEAVLNHPEAVDAIIIGCDSSLEFRGESLGKPHRPEVARDRWLAMRGESGRLFSGHHLIDNRINTDSATPTLGGAKPAVTRVSNATVFFANLGNHEIDAYVATGEPLKVAGAFTIDGLGGAFISSIQGDPHTVIGLSLPTLREMAIELGVDYSTFWNR